MGSPVLDSDTKDFAQFLEDHTLTELKSVGRKYTWTNGHVFSKLYSAIFYTDCMERFPHIEAIVMDPECPNYTPIGVQC